MMELCVFIYTAIGCLFFLAASRHPKSRKLGKKLLVVIPMWFPFFVVSLAMTLREDA